MTEQKTPQPRQGAAAAPRSPTPSTPTPRPSELQGYLTQLAAGSAAAHLVSQHGWLAD